MVLPGTIRDSRRITGPNLVTDRAGAMLEVDLPEGSEALIGLWQEEARRTLDALDWDTEIAAVRRFPGGASLAITAPIDVLYSATEVNEWAWAAATARANGEPVDREPELARLRDLIAEERRPDIIALHRAAQARGVRFFWDERSVMVGSGTGSLTWPKDVLPAPDAVDWAAVHDIPVALVTGSNGKTTVTRLVAGMMAASGRVAGHTSTDGIKIGSEELGTGDYSGPSGARILLRDRRVEMAVLETARGGLLRRGVMVTGAQAALVTNIAEDHLGESGVYSLSDLAATKLVVARALAPGRSVVLNADDPWLVAAAPGLTGPIAWFSLDEANSQLRSARASGGLTATVRGDSLLIGTGESLREVTTVDRVPITLGGAARYNVANALAASLVGTLLGLDDEAIAAGLAALTNSPGSNWGRLNSFEFGGVRAFVDFAHNPHGIHALMEMAGALPARRRLVVIGQAGDRDNHAILELARTAWGGGPDRILVKEMPRFLRGRPPGEVSGMLLDELRRLGARDDQIELTEAELPAVRSALAWAREGDLLLLTVQSERDTVLRYLQQLESSGWMPGRPLPT